MDNKTTTQTYYGFILVLNRNGKICGCFPMSKKECVFGRSKDSDIRILLDSVSTHHCILFYLDDKAYIRDKSIVGSTKVNGKKIGRNNFLLHHSDVIDIVGRKFIWKYTKSYVGCNILPGQESNCVTPKISQHSSILVTPLVYQNNEISYTPAKSSSTTLLSINKTPIITTKINMSKSSFDKLKNSLKITNSDISCKLEPRLTTSKSVEVGHNIPVISNSKVIQRKSWVIPSVTSNVSPVKIYNLNNLSRLSSDSLNIHPNPSNSNHNSDDVEFNTSKCGLPNNEHSVDTSTALFSNNSSIENPSELIDETVDNHSPFKNIQIDKLLDSEPEPSTSRRDTYSIDNEQIMFEQNTTPAPRRSILKCSKTTRPIRSRSSCRMVQFAHLPKSDSKVKTSKNQSNLRFNFSDNNNETSLFQDSKKVMKINSEEYDDDLDGVQPLDSSVSSLINSPILDNSSINKSSKRGSRGNKVLSLISSFEKRIFDSPKHSIRASDLLSMTESKHEDSLSTTDFENNTTVLQESVSSRRVNLENVFIAEDSLKNTCNFKNETIISETEKSLIHNVETTLNSKQDLNNTATGIISDNLAEDDIESEFNFALPLILQLQNMSSTISVTSPNHSTFVDPEKNQINDKIENSSSVYKLNNISNHNLNHSKHLINAKENNINDVETFNSVEKPEANENEHTQKENNIDDIEIFEVKENEHTQIEHNIDVETLNSIEKSKAKENENAQKENNIDDVEILDAKENEHTQTEHNIDVETLNSIEKSEAKKNISKLIEQVIEESPSISKIAHCLSEIFNISKDDLETTNSQHQESITKTYVLVEKEDQNKSNVNEADKNNSDQFDKPIKPTKHSYTIDNELEISNTCPPKKIVKVLNISTDNSSNEIEDNENTDNVDESLECTMSTLIGKPQYESTPWNFSTSNTTLCVQQNITSYNNVSKNESKPKKNLVASVASEQEVWSQLMKDFNESVKKASISNNNVVHVSTINKNLFDEESESFKVASQVVPKDVLLNSKIVKNVISNIDKNNILQCSTITSCSPNTLKPESTNDHDRQSFRSRNNKSILRRKSPKVQNIKKMSITSESSIHDVISWSKNNSISTTITTANKSNRKSETKTVFLNNKNSNAMKKKLLVIPQKITSDTESDVVASANEHDYSTDNDSLSSCVSNKPKPVKKKVNNVSPNVFTKRNLRSIVKKNDSTKLAKILTKKRTKYSPTSTKVLSTSIKELCNKQQNLIIGESKPAVKDSKKQTLIKPKKNVSFVENNFAKIKPVIEKSSPKRITRSNSTLIETSIPKLDKKNKIASPINRTKSAKVGKAVQKKKPTKKALPKCVLPSKPVKTNTNDFSEYETSIPELDKKNKIVCPINKTKSAKVGKAVQRKKPTKRALPKRALPSKPVKTTTNDSSEYETSIPELDKKNKIASPINRTKSAKVRKAVQKKKPTKKTLPKHVLPFKLIKTNTSDSSEYEETTSKEESTPKICAPSKTKKEDNKFTRKEKDNKVNNYGSLTNKRNQKEKIGESSSNVSSYLSTQSRKRTADTPIVQQITKSPKSDISSKVVANSLQKYSLSEIRRTRNMSKLTVKASDNFSKTVHVNKMEKSTQKTNSRKRVLRSEVSSNDSEQSTRKKPKKATEENEETKMKINSFISSEKNKIQSTDIQEELNKNAVKKSKSLIKPKKITRGAKQVPKELSSTRVLRARDKKNK